MKRLETKTAEVQGGNEKTERPGKLKPVTVLHVDDDPNDTALLQVACAKADVDFEIHNVGDGDQVMDYLAGTGKYADRARYRLPGLVLLDLKMPRVEGLEVLKWIRSNATLRDLQVIVLSGSELQDDIRKAYAVGANSYLVKPPSFNSLISLVREIDASLPSARL
jgi:CheY-like chemotaxis protein